MNWSILRPAFKFVEDLIEWATSPSERLIITVLQLCVELRASHYVQRFRICLEAQNIMTILKQLQFCIIILHGVAKSPQSFNLSKDDRCSFSTGEHHLPDL